MDEAVLMILVKQYADRFGITFSSSHLDDVNKKHQLVKLMQQALAGERGPVTDTDLEAD
ncbi:hypothetical protein Q7C_698 [Methylophaga frappieri]|jgi:hypothetical protein|uniref:Uncharacterized protein n=1 Tax=Methylophaga frappieri (strain ATCC BAA-2434 / DSM 25690 / JAM7) TaxID=754477 RepID=I1YG26_METFJ|nr:hypothetical protein [Methylophaga frappieri]AFJ01869.1 hypothetical protein Q7C_698 [Methylophaga frappieri]